jgi:flagellar secretion chaperone FliS
VTDFAMARTAYAGQGMSTASPARILVMLYDRLLLDLRRADAAQEQEEWGEALSQLFHAQTIVLELSSSLRPELWSGGEGLLSVYGYVSRLIARATTGHDATATRRAIEVVEPLLESWREAATGLATGEGMIGVA